MRVILVVMVCIMIFGCPLTMEPVWNDLKLYNNSDQAIQTMFNGSYPDSSFQNAYISEYVDKNSSIYINNDLSLKNDEERYPGVTIFAFKRAYFDDNYDFSKPNKGLDSTKLLKKWVLSRANLDSLNWELNYP